MLVFTDFLRRFGGPDPTAKTGYSIPSQNQSILVSLMSIGSLIGALSGAYTADWWGRRKSLSFGVVLFIIGNIIQITAMESWIHMMMGRFVAGLGVGNLSVGMLAVDVMLGDWRNVANINQVYLCSSQNAAPERSEVPLSPPTNS